MKYLDRLDYGNVEFINEKIFMLSSKYHMHTYNKKDGFFKTKRMPGKEFEVKVAENDTNVLLMYFNENQIIFMLKEKTPTRKTQHTKQLTLAGFAN